MQINVPVMVPSRSTKWENDVRVKGHDLHTGPTITKITETRVMGFFWVPGNGVFDVSRSKYGFRAGGSGDAYYFSDIGKPITA